MNGLTVAGGVYRERCRFPRSDEIWGSGGRAAAVAAGLGCQVALRTLADKYATAHMKSAGALMGFTVDAVTIESTRTFEYLHALAEPSVYPAIPAVPQANLAVTADKVLAFGTVEAEIEVRANWIVYDPQCPANPIPLAVKHNGGARIAYVLNQTEALQLSKAPTVKEAAEAIAAQQSLEIVVVKNGPHGVLIWEGGRLTTSPAYASNFVFSIGSGDVFSATFASEWAVRGLSATEAAARASRAVALYVNSRVLPIARAEIEDVDRFPFAPLANVREAQVGEFDVYLAGPFFNIAQIWLVEEVLHALKTMGLRVFSPYHDVGLGSGNDVAAEDLDGLKRSRAVLAIVDGADTGTMVEIGYARALGKPVVAFVESTPQEALTMILGTDCIVTSDFVTSVYKVAWAART